MSDGANDDKHGRSATYSAPEENEVGGGDGDCTPRPSPRLRAASGTEVRDEQSFITPPRPIIGPRSWTSPNSPPQRTPLRRSRPSFGRRRSPEREWSVFGQRMENEGQLRSPESLRLKRRLSRQSVLEGTTSSLMGQSRPDSIVEEGPSAIQSPVQETFSPEVSAEDDSTLSDCDSDDSQQNVESSSSSLPMNDTTSRKAAPWFSRKIPDIPILYKNILKCSIAYFIGSLFTFVPALAHFVGGISAGGDKRPSPSGHMVATVYVCISYALEVF